MVPLIRWTTFRRNTIYDVVNVSTTEYFDQERVQLKDYKLFQVIYILLRQRLIHLVFKTHN